MESFLLRIIFFIEMRQTELGKLLIQREVGKHYQLLILSLLIPQKKPAW